MPKKWTNWAKNQYSNPHKIFRPKSEAEITEIVSLGVAKRLKVRPIGNGHSFSSIGLTDGFLVSLESMNPILLSPRKGSIVTDKKSLSQCSVDLELIDEKKLKKINIFQYKNKTGNRRRVGYRDEVKVVKVKSISNNKSGEEE